MELETPDVLVAGLGPAGSCAAAAAAAAGLSVVAIERRGSAGLPVQCAEFVPAPLESEISGLNAVSMQPIGRMLTFVENADPDEMPRFMGQMIDRCAFDRLLANEAARAGAECRYGIALARLDADGTAHFSDGSALRPRVLIGADGPRSRVGAAIGQINRELVETRQITVSLTRAHDATDVFLRAEYRGGYGWLFPKGTCANVGIGVVPAARASLKPLLASLHRELVEANRVGGKATHLTGGAIPVGGRLPAVGALGATRVLLAGDAAGLTNPVTGAGIAAAVQSGTLAGRAVADWFAGRGANLDAYGEELGDLFDDALARARRRREALLACYRGGAHPNTAALRENWIAYPQYWAA